jgi:hypothetical protein
MDLLRNHGGQKYSVLGLTIVEPELIKRTKNVILSCLALTLISLFVCLIEMRAARQQSSSSSSYVVQPLLGLLSSLTAPAFGYFGARRGSATLMCMFVSLMVVNAGLSITFVLAVIFTLGIPMDSFMNFSYFLLWVLSSGLSIWAAYNGNKMFSKLLQGEQIIEEQKDPEMALPEIDTQLPVIHELGRKRIFSDLDEDQENNSKKHSQTALRNINE